MRVNIDIQEKEETWKEEGLFSMFKQPNVIRMWRVVWQVELSQEEKNTLTRYDLWNHQVMEFEEDPHTLTPKQREIVYGLPPVSVTVKDIVNEGNVRGFNYSDPVKAQRFAQKLETEIFPIIKSYITASGEIAKDQRRTLEF